MKKFFTITAFIFTVTGATSLFAQNAEQAELEKYIKVFTDGSTREQLDACNKLQWSGITDTRLFDLIEKRFNKKYPYAATKPDINAAAWYAKALAVSGQDKYLPTLKKAATDALNKKTRAYAEKAIKAFDDYVRWNPIISNSTNFKQGEPLQVNRYVNMLNSDEWDLKLIAAKRTHYEQLYNEYLLKTIKDDLAEHHKKVYNENLKISVLKWYSKALAASGKYRKFLNMEVANNAYHKKVRSYAKKVIKKYR